MPHRLRVAAYDRCVEQLNDLLLAEAAAVEAYQQAARCPERCDDPDVLNNRGLLREMREDHDRAVRILRQRVEALGGRPAEPSAMWEMFPDDGRDMCRDPSVLAQLKEGEELALRQFQQTLDTLDSQSAWLIRMELMPAHERHIDVLEQLIEFARGS
jgi:hypothetical protein